MKDFKFILFCSIICLAFSSCSTILLSVNQSEKPSEKDGYIGIQFIEDRYLLQIFNSCTLRIVNRENGERYSLGSEFGLGLKILKLPEGSYVIDSVSYIVSSGSNNRSVTYYVQVPAEALTPFDITKGKINYLGNFYMKRYFYLLGSDLKLNWEIENLANVRETINKKYLNLQDLELVNTFASE